MCKHHLIMRIQLTILKNNINLYTSVHIIIFIYTETIMGVNLRSQDGKSGDYVKAIKK